MHTALQRLDANRVRVHTPNGLDITLFANDRVFLDPASVDEILAFSTLTDTLTALNAVGFFGDAPAHIERIVLTPDFHRGAGIPVGTVLDVRGFVLPKAVGTDIGCGMRLMTTDVTDVEFARLGDDLDQRLRYIFFEGGRNIPMSAAQRTAMFRDGLQGLLQCPHSGEGVWQRWDADAQEADLMRAHRLGALPTEGVFGLDDFIVGSGQSFSRDGQIGSIGGGNHFVEVQRVEEIFDGATARAWGLKRGTVTIMAHSGSVGIGHLVGAHFADVAKAAFLGGARRPEHGFYPLAAGSGAGRLYLSAMGNAGNFAATNRLFLGLMTVRALSEALGREVEARLVYDAPHNLIWDQGDGQMIHRKGACPADGPSDDPEFPSGHPVIIPGSMGASSYVLRGYGLAASLCSACHGAGRLAPRQQARRGSTAELEPLRVVTKVDQRRLRRDVRTDWERSLLEEAPSRYKDVTPVIETVTGAGIASRVARLWPLLTVKGL
jgi:tRNA-splicing ligase RtcB (3'-phosphate/5'-hydroxy nucleic acid ligase)